MTVGAATPGSQHHDEQMLLTVASLIPLSRLPACCGHRIRCHLNDVTLV